MPPSAEEKPTAELNVPAPPAPGEELVLRIFSEEGSTTYRLPPSGEVSLGRSREADLRIDLPTISRKHAVIDIGNRLRVRDLGSSHGTRVGNQPARDGEWVEILPGETIELGNVMGVIQRVRTQARPLRIWSHGAFEARVEDACSDSEPGGFAVARLRLDRPLDPSIVAQVVHGKLRQGECIAAFAPGDYELLLRSEPSNPFEERLAKLAAAVKEHTGLVASTGLSTFSSDGLSPDELIERASPRRVGSTAPDAPVVVDPEMIRLHQLIERIARGEINVLIDGETGAGKERVAEAVHQKSNRASKPLVRINCAAVTEALLESELFGHEKGAFTGATQPRAGLLISAQGGTVLLDEVGEMPSNLQTKLLRVLEEKAVRPVGSDKPRPLDVRFVAATNRNLEQEVAAGRFRRDLFFRLAGVTLSVPPLRQRPTEISALAQRFLEQTWRDLGRAGTPTLTGEAQELLRRYAWPGNIRELKNMMERAALLAPGDRISPAELPTDKMAATWLEQPQAAPAAPTTHAVESLSAPIRPEEVEERQRIIDALNQCGGNQTRAAQLLGISRRTLLYRLDAYGLPRPQKPAAR